MVVRGEKSNTTDVGSDVVEYGLRDRYSIIAAGAPTQFIEDDEGAGSGFGENLFGFRELDEEGGLSGEDVVIGA